LYIYIYICWSLVAEHRVRLILFDNTAMHFSIKTEMSEIFLLILYKFEHADFKYRDEIWPSHRNFAQVKLFVYSVFKFH